MSALCVESKRKNQFAEEHNKNHQGDEHEGSIFFGGKTYGCSENTEKRCKHQQ